MHWSEKFLVGEESCEAGVRTYVVYVSWSGQGIVGSGIASSTSKGIISLLSLLGDFFLPTRRCRGLLLHLIIRGDAYKLGRIPGRKMGQSHRHLPGNTQHSQDRHIHAPGGIRTRSPSKRTAVDLHL